MRHDYEKRCFSDDLISFNNWFRLFKENAEYPTTMQDQVNSTLDEMISIQQNILSINFGDNDYSQEKIDYLITKELGKLEYLKEGLMTMRGLGFSN